MHGFGDQLTTGERIAHYRARRGLTQSVLANLVGRTEDWLSKIERGEREIRRVDVLVDLARELRVTLGDLIGQPALAEDDRHDDDVPAVREALMSPRLLSRTLFRHPASSPPDIASARRLATFAWDDYQAGRLGRVTAALPGLILTAQALEDTADTAGDAGQHFAISARIHHLATTTLMKFGETDLAWIAAERALRASDASGDPLVLGSAARAGTHALLGLGRYAEAIELGTTAVEWMRAQIEASDDVALSLSGMLQLRLAVAAARRADRTASSDFLDQAARAARKLGRDANLWHTGFGPTNVVLHRMAVALDLGDVAFLVEHGPRVNVDHMPAERATSFQVDLARGLSLAARDGDAVELLLSAEQVSPGIVRHSPLAREALREMHRRDRGRSELLSGLAERCRVVA
ncbi:XRE family transcriptional regulator [Gryllotalpicola protaetiae]|uniref:XRE family transcriptional regulator n=2 Tax=Gryllotalpicola protaetiae TaxID=2419771 RepID=A0A387BJ90_9MICO|nr:XRE family transcriptional regulator [Gryllotalpicola protaetiae]